MYVFIFGKITSFRAITILFYFGLLPLIVPSFYMGNFIYLTNTYSTEIQTSFNGQLMSTFQDVNNVPLGVIGGVVTFIILSIIWKMVCELLIILFKYFETNTQKNI
ncbi:hypothetical protein DOT_2523 [Desulfosporosinus sp. OT]|nr:hypothetical protein DOT_2523 [Desulfosporosinus sp. OT]